MKTAVASLAIIQLFLATVSGQEYQFSVPVTGSLTLTARDANTGQSGSSDLVITYLTETVYIDPVANTIRQAGTFSFTSSGSPITLSKTTLGGVSSTLEVSLAPVGSVLPFDTGAKPLSGGSGGQYIFDSVIPSLGQFNASYTLRSGGDVVNGSFVFGMDAFFVPNYGGYGGLLTTEYPESITLNNVVRQNGYFTPMPFYPHHISAPNGATWDLALGTTYWSSELFSLDLPSSITATPVVVPEPSTIIAAALLLLPFGASTLRLIRRKR